MKTNDIENLWNLPHALLHTIHNMLPSPNITVHTGADPISEKKLEKGEGMWDVQTEILGWILDGMKSASNTPLIRWKRSWRKFEMTCDHRKEFGSKTLKN